MSEATTGEEGEPRNEYLATLRHTAALAKATAFEPTTVFGDGAAEHSSLPNTLGPGVVGPNEKQRWCGSLVTISATPFTIDGKISGYSSGTERPLQFLQIGMSATDGTDDMSRHDDLFRIQLHPVEPTMTGITPESVGKIQVTRRTPADLGTAVQQDFTFLKDEGDLSGDYVTAMVKDQDGQREATLQELASLEAGIRSFGKRHAAIRAWEVGEELAQALDEATSEAVLKVTPLGLGRLATSRKKIERTQGEAAKTAARATYTKHFIKQRFGLEEWQADHPITH